MIFGTFSLNINAANFERLNVNMVLKRWNGYLPAVRFGLSANGP